MDKEKQIEDKKQLIEILKNSKDIVSYQPNAYKLLTLNGNDKKFFVTSNDGNVTIHFNKIVDEIYKQGYRKVVKCKDCIHRGTTNCALYYGTIVNESETSVIFGGACHNDDFYCAYGEKKPE